MARSLFALAALLLTGAVLATPIPEPFVSGWDSPVDPDKDCKIRRHRGALTIEMPGTVHGYDPNRKRVNAPRLLREFEGDFEIEVRVKIDCRPSVQSTVKNQPSYVSAGFLIIPPDIFYTNCIRLEYRIAGQGDGADGCVAAMVQNFEDGQRDGVVGYKPPDWPFKGKPEYIYLRLERWGEILSYKISPDGRSWASTFGGGQKSGLPYKLKVGFVACSTSSEPSKIHFDQLRITRGKKRERWEFVSGWDGPMDPDKDCQIKRDKDALTIEMPGSDHDYDPVRKRFNAPRLLSELEGDFDLEVRIRIDYRPTAQSTVKDQPSFVSAGFLLIYPDTHQSICRRLEYAVSQQGSKFDGYAIAPCLAEPRRKDPALKGMEADSYAVERFWLCKPRKAKGAEWDHGMPRQLGTAIWDRGWQNWPLPEKADSAYLRLEQRDDWFCCFISRDGKKWTALSHQRSLPAKSKVGLAACSTSPKPSKVIFDQLKLAGGKKKE